MSVSGYAGKILRVDFHKSKSKHKVEGEQNAGFFPFDRV